MLLAEQALRRHAGDDVGTVHEALDGSGGAELDELVVTYSGRADGDQLGAQL